MGAAMSSARKRVGASLLSCWQLPHAHPALCAGLGIGAAVVGSGRSLAVMTCDQDDALYAALDHATKMAAVEVVYARSLYAGSAHASGPLSGEVLAVLAGDEPESVAQGVAAVRDALEGLFAFESVGDAGVMVFAAAIGRIGRYLAAQSGVPEGGSLGYFIAPPTEALVGLDAALKTAEVRLVRFFGPPTETNFAGGYVTGSLDAVEAAGRAFVAAVEAVANDPRRGG